MSTEKAEPPPCLPFIRCPVLRSGTGFLREGELAINVCGEAQSGGGHARPCAEAIAKGLGVAEPLGMSFCVNLPTPLAGLAAKNRPLEKVDLPINVGVTCGVDQGMQLLSPNA